MEPGVGSSVEMEPGKGDHRGDGAWERALWRQSLWGRVLS